MGRKSRREVEEKNTDGVVKDVVQLVKSQEKLAQKAGKQAVDFVLCHPGAKKETLQALADALDEKKCKKSAELLRETIADMKEEKEETETYDNPVEAFVAEKTINDSIYNTLLSGDMDWKKILADNPDFKYSETGKQCSKEVAAFIIAAYARQADAVKNKTPIASYKENYAPIHKDADADKAAEMLDKEGLLKLLYTIACQMKRMECAAALGRYADDKRAAELIKMMGKWADWCTYGVPGRYAVMAARGGLMLNDTRTAAMHMDKVGLLEDYAKMRGTDAETMRDTVLADFGLDGDGRKTYDLGGRTVSASIDNELKITLFDETAGKTVKSLPKKDADPEKLAAANADLADLKKNVKKVVKARCDRLFDDFLSGNTYGAEKWKQAYLGNPVLERAAALIVWNQGTRTFTLKGGKPVTCSGEEYKISSKPIGVAHPMEMEPAEVEAWQQYFMAGRLKQPFEQVWEPVIKPEEVKEDRYEGQKVSVFRFMHAEKHGITFWDEDFHNSIGFELTGCDIDYDRTTPNRHSIERDETFTLGKFTIEKYDRRVNHIVALLDRWTVYGRILSDDVSVRNILHGFTAAQILEFIRLASENGCAECAAMLLEYKQNTYPDYDPMAEFTLD